MTDDKEITVKVGIDTSDIEKCENLAEKLVNTLALAKKQTAEIEQVLKQMNVIVKL